MTAELCWKGPYNNCENQPGGVIVCTHKRQWWWWRFLLLFLWPSSQVTRDWGGQNKTKKKEKKYVRGSLSSSHLRTDEQHSLVCSTTPIIRSYVVFPARAKKVIKSCWENKKNTVSHSIERSKFQYVLLLLDDLL